MISIMISAARVGGLAGVSVCTRLGGDGEGVSALLTCHSGEGRAGVAATLSFEILLAPAFGRDAGWGAGAGDLGSSPPLEDAANGGGASSSSTSASTLRRLPTSLADSLLLAREPSLWLRTRPLSALMAAVTRRRRAA